MADWYDKTLSKIGKGLIDLNSLSNPKIVPVTSGYVFNQAHEFYSDITPAERVAVEAAMVNVVFGSNNSSATSYKESVIEAGPSWYWRLDESAGTNAVDEMGNDDLTYGQNASTSGYSVASSLFSGDGQSKDLAPGLALATIRDTSGSGGELTTSDFTIECALKISTNTLAMILMGTSAAGSGQDEWQIRVDPSNINLLRFDLEESGGTNRTDNISISASSLADGLWHYLSIRMDYDGTALLTIEVDGVERSSIDVSTWSGAWKTNHANAHMTIGDNSIATANYWKGEVDEVPIYLKAITDQQRINNYTWWKVGIVESGKHGWLNADDPVIAAPTVDDIIEAFVMFNDTGVEATSPILFYANSGLGLPYTVATTAAINVQLGSDGIAQL